MALSTSSRRFLLVLVVGGALAGAGVYALGSGLGPLDQLTCDEPDNAGEEVVFTIPAGASAADVGESLESQGVTCSASAFRSAAQDAGIDSSLAAGDYALVVGMSGEEVAEVMAEGPTAPESLRVTIAEGLTVAQTLERLAENTPHTVEDYRAVLDARVAAGGNGEDVLTVPEFVPAPDEFGEEVREPFEGLLYPLTYEFELEAGPQQILQRMIDELAAVVEGLDAGAVQAFTDEGYTLYDALKIASLVEREARVEDERDTIASVVRNRLADGQLLQIDAAVLYGQGDPAAGAEAVDPSVSSAYNLYEVAGLPPTPIAGFRGSILRSAIDPPESDFFYYVVSPDCDGSHNFATTLDEHNQNVAAYREAGRCAE